MNETSNKTTFKSMIAEKQAEFEGLLHKFENLVDPVERYIKRMEMAKIKKWLDQFDVHVDIP
ncbi:MAG: hypothetical protein DRO88_13135 [Promethearchaeia archaeon]|nr:MAG: hypothetical protein DRO88_13135 [Candidatus Lokiarchaeia archaeon]